MVDVSGKPETQRIARAQARVLMSTETAQLVRDASGRKGDVIAVARIAGIQAAKRTDELIPLCHQVPLDGVAVEIEVDVESGVVTIEATARTTHRTGVEMEAMTAASVAALTVYDMVKGVERAVTIEQIALLEKRGGRSDWSADE